MRSQTLGAAALVGVMTVASCASLDRMIAAWLRALAIACDSLLIQVLQAHMLCMSLCDAMTLPVASLGVAHCRTGCSVAKLVLSTTVHLVSAGQVTLSVALKTKLLTLAR